MPAHFSANLHGSPFAGATDATESSEDVPQRVYLSPGDGEAIENIRHELMAGDPSPEYRPQYAEPHSSFDKFLVDEVHAGKKKKTNLGVGFRSLTTWGKSEGQANVKTFATAMWRTLTLQDIYEWTLKPWVTKTEPENGRPLIRDMSGVVRSGEMMLVLGRPGAGCSTFLRTIACHHSSFLGVTGSIDYSGLGQEELKKHFHGQVAYVPEDDQHFPTINVRQTLEFALQCKTPKRYQDRISRYLDIYGRVFGMSHTMDTLVGNEFIRGVSGGERKRISIIESLATDSSVTCWDNSTRGLDASSALDYVRSLRIMTDTCGKATLLTLYQASDAIFELVDKVLLIDEGRMLFQGPAWEAKQYFEELGYECGNMQTTADFLTSITVPERRRFRPGWEHRAPKGPVELEEAFRNSVAFQKVQGDLELYESQQYSRQGSCTTQTQSDNGSLEEFKHNVRTDKSRFVSSESPYTISLFRQVVLCTKRQLWQLKGHMQPLYMKLVSAVIYGLLIGSMFYNQPETTDGVYSRGGMLFYSTILLAWLQLSELEDAMEGRDVISRQKKFAFVRPSAVCLARVVSDIVVSFLITALYLVTVYFLAGLKMDAGPFFINFLFIYMCTVTLTGQFRTFAAVSTDFEVALRYCGVSVLFSMIFCGYLISLDELTANVPWVGWISYIVPARYAYEAVMIGEFHNSDFACTPGSVVPSGPGYSDVAYQTCGYTANRVGTTVINGDNYLSAQYGFHSSHLWRNFGILCLFLLGFTLINCLLNETMEWQPESAGPIQYAKRKGTKRQKSPNVQDEESAPVEVEVNPPAYPGNVGDQAVQYLSGNKSSFTWDNLELDVQAGKDSKRLLNGVSGYCKPGTLTALVGSSGAGKSTLLNTLTQQRTGGKLDGTLFVDGNPVDQSFNRKIGFCQQMDIHDETSTVREAFEFAALLRQGRDIPKDDKLTYVDTVLDTLGLVELQDAIIGSLDIEKKKRVTIGVELCAKPKLLLFLDEPTSGLDSQGASTIVELLRGLANQGLAILCTIHQANQEQFEQFDRVLALSPGGHPYYFGQVGESGQAIFNYFGRYAQKPSRVTNAADYLIDVVTSGIKKEHNIDWPSIWKQSPEAQNVKDEIAELRQTPISKKSDLNESDDLRPAPIWDQIRLLTKRTCLQFWRSPEYPYSRLYACFIHALFNGLTYLQIGNSSTDMQSKAFSCFLIILLVPDFINGISMRVIMNRDLWNARERPSGVYGWVAFSTAQILSEIPYALIGAILFYIPYYFLVGLPLGFPAGYTFLMIVLFIVFCTSWGQWIGALCPDSVVAATSMPFFIIMCELFNGILQRHQQMPVIWKYTMYYITPFTYWIGGILSAILKGMPVTCEENELAVFQSPSNMTCGEYAGPWLSKKGVGYLSNPDDYGLCGYCEYSYGDDYLNTMELGSSKIWPYLGIFMAFVVTNYALVYLLVYLRSVMKPFWRR